MHEPPPGYDDCEADGLRSPTPPGHPYHPLEVPDVGLVHARRPLPNAIPALAGAANSKVSDRSRVDYLTLFVQNHLAPGEFEELLVRMTEFDTPLPDDTMLRVSRAIATVGTARPTVPSSG